VILNYTTTGSFNAHPITAVLVAETATTLLAVSVTDLLIRRTLVVRKTTDTFATGCIAA